MMRTIAPRMWFVPLLAVVLLGAADRPASLIEAAKRGDATTVRALVKQGAPVNVASGDGTTALHWASYRDGLVSADLLLRAGARVNAANDLGTTPLWIASLNGSAAMVDRLLKAGADPNLALRLGETPLMAASRAGATAVVERLLVKGAQVNARAARAQTALMWAVAQKHPEVVKRLLAHGADVHARSAVWSEVMAVEPHGERANNRAIPQGGDTALMFAARVGDLASARLLVETGANINDTDAWGVSATAMAAHAGFGDVVAFLLERGADANAAAAGFSALHVAVMRRDIAMAAALLRHGADPNARVRNWTPTRRASDDYNFPPALVGATPFWLAARFSQPQVMRLLVTHGADPHVILRVDYPTGGLDGPSRRRDATTALMAATGMGGGRAWFPVPRSEAEPLVLEAVQIATELGVDVNAINLDGRTALDAAQALKYPSVVNYLVQHGATPGKKRPAEASSDSQ